jgi:glycosyltransferase involved in cell wall biosynthesis
LRDDGGGAPVISVCIVTGRRLALLDGVLADLRAQREAPPYELLVCSDGDPDVRALVHDRFPGARVCEVRRALPGAARNLLVEQARGELLLFLDDDIRLAPDLLARYGRVAADHPDLDVFGGPNETPPGSSRFQFVQGAALASMVGSGPVRRRYGAHPPGVADERFFILCNLAVRRAAMVPFANDLVCAEENAVLAEMARRGARMYYSPDLAVYHERRGSLRGFASQMHKYGRGRGQLLARRQRTFRPAYLAPSALLAYLVVLPALLLVGGPVAAVPALLWLAAVGAAAVWIARTLGRPADVFLAATLVVVLHVCYGSGVVRGALGGRRAVTAPEPVAWTSAAPDPGTVARLP